MTYDIKFTSKSIVLVQVNYTTNILILNRNNYFLLILPVIQCHVKYVYIFEL